MDTLSIAAFVNRIRSRLNSSPDSFLSQVSGVIHVGANTGQERENYRRLGLRVVWVEPIPSVFSTLEANLSGIPNQRAIQGLVTDRDDAEYEFHIASNDGASSSIMELKYHKDIWPDVTYMETICIKSTTLASMLARERIDPTSYQALVMDTQGSELLVLKGSIPVLRHFEFVKTEVPDFESYAGCCQLVDIDAFMTEHGYIELCREQFATRDQGGSYFDVVYRKANRRR